MPEGTFGIPQGFKGYPTQQANWSGISCLLGQTGNQTIATAGPYVDLTWNYIYYDTDNMVDLNANNKVITIRTPGIYMVHGNTEWATGSSTGERDQKFLFVTCTSRDSKNLLWSTIGDWARCSIPVNNTAVNTIHFSFFCLPLNVGDQIKMQVAQNSGGNLNIIADNSRPNFGAFKIG